MRYLKAFEELDGEIIGESINESKLFEDVVKNIPNYINFLGSLTKQILR